VKNKKTIEVHHRSTFKLTKTQGGLEICLYHSGTFALCRFFVRPKQNYRIPQGFCSIPPWGVHLESAVYM